MSFLQKHTHFSTDFYKVFYNKKFRLAICSNSCHSEKTENLASSVDFRLIQNQSMLIIFMLSGWVPRPTVTTAVYTADTNLFTYSLIALFASDTVFSLLTFHFSLIILFTFISLSAQVT